MAEKSWPLGTQAAPVCEVGVFPHDRLMTTDCSGIVSVPPRPGFSRQA
jgi:hypothetical protein